MSSIKPNVLIVGAQKSGTTALAKNLGESASVWDVPVELHFFSDNYHKGLRWYESQIEGLYSKVCHGDFEDSQKDVVIERSPSYMSEPEAAKRIYDYNPNIKIIVSLRDPIDRAFSRYQDILADEPWRIKRTFARTVSKSIRHGHHFTENGFYANQLRPYFDLFPRQNIYVNVQERLLAQGSAELNKIANFLDIPANFTSMKLHHKNKYSDEIDSETLEKLINLYRTPNQLLFELIGFEIEEWKC